VGSAYPALVEVTGISLKEVYGDPRAGIELYRQGRPLIREMFGPEVGLPALSTPAISYGHVNGLGAELIFPDGGEVSYTELCETLEAGIDILSRDTDFASAGMARFYLDYKQTMEEAFDGAPCAFSYGYEGPMTTAYELRGDRVFCDPYDEPERFKVLMRLLVDSIVQFAHFHSQANGRTCPDPQGWGLCDDVASMFGPAMWPAFVLPYLEQYYRGLTSGRRSAHIEDLRPDHLPYLETIGLARFDPSISPRICPKDIYDRCRVPFGWRLGNFHYRDLSCADVTDWVFKAVADGASSVFTYVSSTMCNDKTATKVDAFIAAAKRVAKMLETGGTREEVGRCVSESGRRRFWNHWPE